MAARETRQIAAVSPADAGFLVAIFLLVCLTFAIEDGLALRLPAAGSPADRSGDFLRVAGGADGVAVGGRQVALDEVRQAVAAHLARRPGALVVADVRPGSGAWAVLDQIRLAGASRVSVRLTRH